MANLTDLLDKDPSTFERPPVLPEGEYVAVVLDHKFGETPGKNGKEKTPFCEFTFGIVSPMESVNEEELADVDLSKAKPRDTFYLTEAAAFRIKDFLEAADCMTGTLKESIDAAKGQQVIITVAHSANDKDPQRPYVNVRGYATAS